MTSPNSERAESRPINDRGAPVDLQADTFRSGLVPLLVAFGSLTFGALLIHTYPVMYWGDPYARLANHEHLLVDRWLPLLQLIIYGVSKATSSVFALRLVLCAVGALTVVAGHSLAARLFNRSFAALFALFLATNPLFVALSIVPYQEVLFAGLIFTGLSLHLAPSRRRARFLAAVAFNLACLTRYEGWILVGIVAATEFSLEAGRGGRLKALGRAAALALRYGWTALAWLIFSISTAGFSRLAGTPSPAHPKLIEFARSYLHQLRWQSGSDLLLVCAATGVAVALTHKAGRRTHATILAFVAVNVAFIFFVDPYSPGNLRTTFIPVVFALFYAARGLEFISGQLIGRAAIPRRGAATSAIAVAAGCIVSLLCIRNAIHFVAEASNEPDRRIPFEVAGWFDRMSSLQRQQKRLALLSPNDLHRAVIATYTGISLARITDVADGRMPADATHAVDIQSPTSMLPAKAVELRERLEKGDLPAEATRLDSAVIWTLHRLDSAPPATERPAP